MRRFLFRAPLTLSLLLLALLPGCQETAVYTAPRVAQVGERLFLAAQIHRPGASEKAFALAATSDPERRNWTAPEILRGRLVGLAGRAETATAVFDSGAVAQLKLSDGRFEVTHAEGGEPRALLAACGIGDELYALAGTEEGFLLLRRAATEWAPAAPVLPAVGGAEGAILTACAGKPCVLWKNRGVFLDPAAPENESPFRAAFLEAGGWQLLPDAPPALQPVEMAALPETEGFLLLALLGGDDPLGGERRAAFWRFGRRGWVRLTGETAQLPETAMPPRAAIALSSDGDRAAVALAAGTIVQCLPLDLRNLRAGAPVRVAGSEITLGPALELMVLFAAALFFLGLGGLHVLLLRRGRRAVMEGRFPVRTLPAAPAPAAAANATEPSIRPVIADTGAGGVAAPMERALALLLDLAVVLPFPIAFLLARDPGFVALATRLAWLDAQTAVERLAPVALSFQIAYSLSFIAYATLCELLTGQTLGKRALSLAVRAAEGGPAGRLRIALRNLLRIVDHMEIPLGTLQLYFFPALLSMIFSRTNQRIGDRVAGTIVVRRVPLSKRRIVLASASPRREALLRELGVDFDILPVGADESVPLARTPGEAAIRIAQRKAEAAGRKLSGGEIVIAADTVIAVDGELVGKPRDRDHARALLRRLAGRRHEAVTGVAVWDRATGRRVGVFDRTELWMRALSEEEIEQYLDTGEWSGKAGAYAIQGRAGAFFEAVHGSFSNVVGLPQELVSSLLRDLET